MYTHLSNALAYARPGDESCSSLHVVTNVDIRLVQVPELISPAGLGLPSQAVSVVARLLGAGQHGVDIQMPQKPDIGIDPIDTIVLAKCPGNSIDEDGAQFGVFRKGSCGPDDGKTASAGILSFFFLNKESSKFIRALATAETSAPENRHRHPIAGESNAAGKERDEITID